MCKPDHEVLEQLLETIRLMESATFRAQAQAIVTAGAQYVAVAADELAASKFSPSARLNFRSRVSGMLRRAAAQVLDLGWQAGGGDPGKAPADIQREYMDNQQTHLSAWFGQIKQTQAIPGGIGRAQMYANSLMGLYRQGWEAAQRLITGMPKLPAEPRDGSTICLMNCMCRWEIVKKSNTEFWAYWKLSPVESCETCLCRGARWNPLKIIKRPAATPGGDAWWEFVEESGTCRLYR